MKVLIKQNYNERWCPLKRKQEIPFTNVSIQLNKLKKLTGGKQSNICSWQKLKQNLQWFKPNQNKYTNKAPSKQTATSTPETGDIQTLCVHAIPSFFFNKSNYVSLGMPVTSCFMKQILLNDRTVNSKFDKREKCCWTMKDSVMQHYAMAAGHS